MIDELLAECKAEGFSILNISERRSGEWSCHVTNWGWVSVFAKAASLEAALTEALATAKYTRSHPQTMYAQPSSAEGALGVEDLGL